MVCSLPTSYPDAAITSLREQFALDGSARVLDLGCGAGQIAIPLAEHVNEVIGMDPNERMLREARRKADASEHEAENTEWVIGSDSDLSNELGTFQLVTMGRSFHWMDQRRTLDQLCSMIEPGGGIAIITDEEWLVRGGQPWHEAVYTLADEYLEALPERTGPTDGEYDDPWDEMVDEFEFTDIEVTSIESEREWEIGSIVGYVFSLSYCSPDIFGDDKDAFEADLRTHLNEREEETFTQDVTVEMITARKTTV
ncbi:class I SAM-dependent methyltransferase [Halocatena marina]|uniref:class I SAM-dependent methyltransferase n=1 Tax=Halocatena marina TaxID=2934937 RepID=UPI003614A25D